MKVKTSITLSDDLLEAIDRHSAQFRSRSEFLETAARGFLTQLARQEAERRDLEILDRRAESLNAEAGDVLAYQVPL
jgi:metal-responsive CopG/Arc/MetJ family transcriptional regulator